MTKMSNSKAQNYQKSVSDDEALNEKSPYIASVDTLSMSSTDFDMKQIPLMGFEKQDNGNQRDVDGEEDNDNANDIHINLNHYQKWTNYKQNTQKPEVLYPDSSHVKYPCYYTKNHTLNTQDNDLSLSSTSIKCPTAQNVSNEMIMGLSPSNISSEDYSYDYTEERSESSQMHNYASVSTPFNTYPPLMSTSQYSMQGLNQHVQHPLQHQTDYYRRTSSYMQSHHQHQSRLHTNSMGLSNFYPNTNYGHGNTGNAMSSSKYFYEAYGTSSHPQTMQYNATAYAQEPILDLLQLSNR